MSAIDSYAKRLAPPGSLIGISTIHFVRWLLIDEGRRLMMVSDYDGSWENYIDEFAELILSGLDAIWETSYGYPPDGARDLPAFKRFLRSHQVPSEVFYSAYPEETVLNIINDRAFARACADAGWPIAWVDLLRQVVSERARDRHVSPMTSWPTSRVSSPAATATCPTPRISSSSFTTPDRRGAGWGASCRRSRPPARGPSRPTARR